MEEKNELEQKLLVLEKMEKEIIDELDALKKINILFKYNKIH